MDDLISRQGTIDRINEYIEEYSEIDSDGNHSEKWCAMQEAKMTIENMPSAQPVDKAYLIAWYIISVDDSDPVWTKAHIEELMNDFYLIPKGV